MGLFKRKKEQPLVDIDKICELQRQLDAYVTYTVVLCDMITNEETGGRILICNTPHDEMVSDAWEKLLEMKKQVNK